MSGLDGFPDGDEADQQQVETQFTEQEPASGAESDRAQVNSGFQGWDNGNDMVVVEWGGPEGLFPEN